jgi:hypothetical protein
MTHTKTDLLNALKEDNTLGIAFNQSGIPLQLMSFREFLDWYADTGRYRYSVDEYYNDDNEEDEYVLVERSAADSRKILNRTQYDSLELAEEAYYYQLELKYRDDNGSGGIYYVNSEAIARLEDDKDEWHMLFEEEINV